MFSLNEQITKWRQGLAQSESITGADLSELESHLRDEIDDLSERGLSQEEAFWVSRHRLGETWCLDVEFAKVNMGLALKRRVVWMAGGVLVYLLAGYFAGALSSGCVLLGSAAGLRGYGLAAVSLGTQVTAITGVMIALCLLCGEVVLPGSSLRGLLNKRATLIVVGVCFAGLCLGLSMTQVVFSAMMSRILSPEEFGRTAMALAYARFAWPVLLPGVLLVLVFGMRGSNVKESRLKEG